MLSSELAQLLRARLLGDTQKLSGIAHLKWAGPGDLSILAWPEQIRQAKNSKASAIITTIEWAADYADQISSSLIIIEDWVQVFKTLKTMQEQNLLSSRLRVWEQEICAVNIAPSACVGRARVGSGTCLGPGALISDDVIIGQDCFINPGVIIHSGTVIADRVSIGANTVIGSEAFAPTGFNNLQALCSLGFVSIASDCRIGALCTIDRGLVGQTYLGPGTHLDSQVHIGHDVRLGANVAIAAQAGLAGFAELGDGVSVGGQAGVAPHAFIAQYARISGQSMARGAIGEYEIWSGSPSMPHQKYLRDYATRLRSS